MTSAASSTSSTIRPDRAADTNCAAGDRYAYRAADVSLELLDDHGPTTCFGAVGRNLSRGGVALLNRGMVYPGSRCRLRLIGPHHHAQHVLGLVIRCRYVLGSGALHEIAVKFDRPIDIGAFTPAARFLRAMIADDNDDICQLIRSFLRGLNVDTLLDVHDADEIVRRAFADCCDLVMLDLESHDYPPFEVATRLRHLGFVGSIVGYGVQITNDIYQRCVDTGLTGYLRKPLTRGAVRRLLTALMDKPTVSTLAHDVTLTPLIDSFVQGLPIHARRVAQCFAENDLEQLAEVAHDLRGQAGSYGFGVITAAAAEIQRLLDTSAPPEPLSSAVDHLIHLCLTARPVGCVEFVAAQSYE